MEKKLYRSRRFRVFGGVAGGLGTYFGLDPILVRVIFVLVALLHGLGILGYIILWIVIPEEPFELAYPINNDAPKTETPKTEGAETPHVETKKNATGSLIFGSVLIVLGLLFLIDRFFPRFSFEDVFPIVIVLIGGALVLNSLKK